MFTIYVRFSRLFAAHRNEEHTQIACRHNNGTYSTGWLQGRIHFKPLAHVLYETGSLLSVEQFFVLVHAASSRGRIFKLLLCEIPVVASRGSWRVVGVRRSHLRHWQSQSGNTVHSQQMSPAAVKSFTTYI